MGKIIRAAVAAGKWATDAPHHMPRWFFLSSSVYIDPLLALVEQHCIV